MPDHLQPVDVPQQFGKLVTKRTPARLRMSMRAAERVRPPLWARVTHLGSIVLCLGATGYMALWHDFGQHEHCFSPLRRWVEGKKKEFLTLSAGEEQELRSTGVIR